MAFNAARRSFDVLPSGVAPRPGCRAPRPGGPAPSLCPPLPLGFSLDRAGAQGSGTGDRHSHPHPRSSRAPGTDESNVLPSAAFPGRVFRAHKPSSSRRPPCHISHQRRPQLRQRLRNPRQNGRRILSLLLGLLLLLAALNNNHINTNNDHINNTNNNDTNANNSTCVYCIYIYIYNMHYIFPLSCACA